MKAVQNSQTDAIIAFTERIAKAAYRCLQNEYPSYVTTFQSEFAKGGVDQAAAAVKGIEIGGKFKTWEKLLEGILDIEITITHLRGSLAMLGMRPDDKFLVACSMNTGSWLDYHYRMYFFTMYGLIDRSEKLLTQSVRALVKPNEKQWPNVQKSLLAPLHDLKDRVGKIRNPLAHTGGPLEGIAEEGLWPIVTVLIVSEQFPDPLDVLGALENRQAARYETLYTFSVSAIVAIEQAFAELTKKVEWGRIR